MNGFVFSLSSLLIFRRNRRDLCRQLLAQILAEEGRLSAERKKLITDRERQFEEIRRLSARGRMAVDGTAFRRYHSGRLLREIQSLDEKSGLVAQQLQICREALAKADAEVKVLERLEEKQLAAFREQLERNAQREREDAWSARRILEAAR